MPQWLGSQVMILKPKPGADIRWICSHEDCKALKDECAIGETEVNWEKTATDHDAMTLANGEHTPGWDVESTAWFNMDELLQTCMQPLQVHECSTKTQDGTAMTRTTCEIEERERQKGQETPKRSKTVKLMEFRSSLPNGGPKTDHSTVTAGLSFLSAAFVLRRNAVMIASCGQDLAQQMLTSLC